MPPLAEFEDLVKFYGPTQALGPVTLNIPEGSVGLLGPNGAGKSTLVRIMMGLIRPTSGVVRVLGEDVKPGSKAIRRRIGYVPEGDAFFPELNGVEAVAFSGRLVGMRGADALQRAHQVLDYVELGEARYRLVEKYSTGMRQRLKLAQALVHDPDLLILDEPTEGVDPEARGHILNLIQEVSKEHGLQLLLSTHLLNDVEKLASHALVLNQGRAVASGTIQELKATPTKSFIVRVNGAPDAFTHRLTEQGIKWEPMQPSVRVFLDDPKQVLQHVKDAGLVVRHLAPSELSLGEAFEQALVGGQTNA
ncbi:MAG TPA: ABC transporter ATP-binding protein [Candidatus Thermoplasmatota archaeon]